MHSKTQLCIPDCLFWFVSLSQHANEPFYSRLGGLLNYFSGFLDLVFEMIWIIRGSSFNTRHHKFNSYLDAFAIHVYRWTVSDYG